MSGAGTEAGGNADAQRAEPRRLRLVARDSAALLAFASMAVSQVLPVWSLVVTGLGILVGLLGFRPFRKHPTLTAALLVLPLLAIYAQVGAGALDLVVGACAFAGCLATQRVLSESTPATDSQIHLLALLMAAGGAALSGDLLYGVCLLGFGIAVTLSLGLGVLEAAAQDGERIPVRPAGRQFVTGALFALLGALLFFVAFPRLSWNVMAIQRGPGIGGTVGFSDAISLSAAGGALKTNPRVVMRVQLSPDPGQRQLSRYFVGRTYSFFTGKGWAASARGRKPSTVVQLGPVKNVQRDDLVKQTIELTPAFGATTALALSPPVRFLSGRRPTDRPGLLTSFVVHNEQEVKLAAPPGEFEYTAYSLPEGEAAPEPVDPAPYLALPEGFDPRISELASRVLGGERDPRRAAQRLTDHLQSNFSYTLELPEGNVPDPVAHFLFERKAGHCEYFATALTLMLRSQGFGARMASGFFGGERDGDDYVIRAGDAHAWTEVLVPGVGFVTYDATPPSGRTAQEGGLREALQERYDRLTEWWRSRVVDYSIREQVSFLKKYFGRGGVFRSRDDDPAEGAKRGPLPYRELGSAALAAAALYALYRISRRRAGPSGPRPNREAVRLLTQTERLLERAKLPIPPGEGLEEVALRLAARDHPAAKPVAKATSAYLSARFGGAALSAKTRRVLVDEVRRGLDERTSG